jgi:hypothetical protein
MLQNANTNRRKSIRVFNNDGFSKIYASMTDACRDLNLNPGHLTEVCQGIRKTNKGYKAKYIS